MSFKEYKETTPYKRCFITPDLRPEIAGQYVLEKDVGTKDAVPIWFYMAIFIPAVIYGMSYTTIGKNLFVIYFFTTLMLIAGYLQQIRKTPFSVPFKENKSLLLLSLLGIFLMILPYNGLRWPQSVSVFYLVKLIILAPIFEELIFRALPFILFRNLKQLIPSVLMSSFYFAILHFSLTNFDLLKFSQHFIFGILLTIVFMQYKKIRYNIAVHSLCNLAGLFLQ